MALKLRLLQSTANPDTFIRTYDDEMLENIYQNIAAQEITFEQWKRVDVVEKRRKRKKIKLIEIKED